MPFLFDVFILCAYVRWLKLKGKYVTDWVGLMKYEKLWKDSGEGIK